MIGNAEVQQVSLKYTWGRVTHVGTYNHHHLDQMAVYTWLRPLDINSFPSHRFEIDAKEVLYDFFGDDKWDVRVVREVSAGGGSRFRAVLIETGQLLAETDALDRQFYDRVFSTLRKQGAQIKQPWSG